MYHSVFQQHMLKLIEAQGVMESYQFELINVQENLDQCPPTRKVLGRT